MPQTDPYLENVYAVLQQTYKENMSKSQEEFIQSMYTDPSYVDNVHALLSQDHPENFKYSIEEFNTKFQPAAPMQQEAEFDFSDGKSVPTGAFMSLSRSATEFVTKQLPAMYADFAVAQDRAGTKFADFLMSSPNGDMDAGRKARSYVEALNAAKGTKTANELSESVDFSGMATELSDIYNTETGEFKPENIGSFGGYALGQTLPQIGLAFATGGASMIPMGVSEAVGAQMDAFADQGKTPEEVFLKGDDKVIEGWAAGVAIGMLDRFSFGKLGAGKETLKTLTDVFKHTAIAGITEFLTEMGQEAIGAFSGEASTRDWEGVKELWNDVHGFWYNRVATAGVMGLIGSS
jgi:hypothetical protein